MLSTATFLDFLLLVISIIGGWTLKVIWDQIIDLKKRQEVQQSDTFNKYTDLSGQLSEIRALIAGEYSRRRDVTDINDTLSDRLLHMERMQSEMNLVVATKYVTKDDFSKAMDQLFAKFDRLNSQISDGK